MRKLGSFWQGVLGAALVLALYVGYGWLSLRYAEFVAMRNVLSQLIQQQQQAAKPPEPPK